MLHFHISSVLPHEIYSTSAIRPYPVALGPGEIASRTAHEWLPQILWPGKRDPGPAVHQELQPEEVARLANRLAGALAAGMEAPRWMNRELLKAAQMIVKGRPFMIKSAGRAVIVRSEAPASWTGIRRETALQGAQPGAVAMRAEAPASWTGIRRELGQPSEILRRARMPASWRNLWRTQPGQVMAVRQGLAGRRR